MSREYIPHCWRGRVAAETEIAYTTRHDGQSGTSIRIAAPRYARQLPRAVLRHWQLDRASGQRLPTDFRFPILAGELHEVIEALQEIERQIAPHVRDDHTDRSTTQ